MATTLFLLGLMSCFGTFAALCYVRPLGLWTIVHFLSSWLQAELAPWHLIWQSVAALLLISGGALDSSLGQWGLALLLVSCAGLVIVIRQSLQSVQVYRTALSAALGENYQEAIPAERRKQIPEAIDSSAWLKPFSFPRACVKVTSDLAYADGGKRNLLDIYSPETPREGGAPVLIQVHGGGWTIGHKAEQAKPLMYHLASKGWVCVSVNYRLCPTVNFPEHIIDVKKAIAWVKDNVAGYGGNPDFIAITGGSAGGHLSSLAALTPNHAAFQPGFEEADTRVHACVPFYGVYDWIGGVTPADAEIRKFLVERVLPSGTEEETEQRLREASPLHHVHTEAPPTLIIHGANDMLAMVEGARTMNRALSAVSKSPVAYAELPGTQHAFEVFHSIRADITVLAVHEFLEWAHAQSSAGESA